jgi:hypothetical protein
LADDLAGGLQGAESVGDGLLAGVESGAQVVEAAGTGGESIDESLLQRSGHERRGSGLADFQTEGVFGESEGEGLWRGCGAVFCGEDEILAAAAEVEVGIAPGVEVGAAAEGLAGVVCGGFACVVDEEDGDVEGAGEVAEGGEDGRDFGGVVFVGALEADVGVEDEKAGAPVCESETEALDVLRAIDPEGRLDDEAEVEVAEGGAAGLAEIFDALADLEGCVFGGVDERMAGARDRVASEAGPSGGDGDGDLEGEPALAALGGAADDADGTGAPKTLDEPGRSRGIGCCDVRGADDG